MSLSWGNCLKRASLHLPPPLETPNYELQSFPYLFFSTGVNRVHALAQSQGTVVAARRGHAFPTHIKRFWWPKISPKNTCRPKFARFLQLSTTCSDALDLIRSDACVLLTNQNRTTRT
ncbi:hypothetical protein JTE90_014526 [Oedothorax gibbosus]|uniref:Uncharacterized protein n=1 Tax=Oedothorax gibbosus TaxID=931172 RepID=A0AAV6UX94_9ARAC|nr:hypothetical protein JTE90_014526 [Oedothorax gibbosus]